MWTEEELEAYGAYLDRMDQEFDNAVGSGLTEWKQILTYVTLILEGDCDESYLRVRFDCL